LPGPIKPLSSSFPFWPEDGLLDKPGIEPPFRPPKNPFLAAQIVTMRQLVQAPARLAQRERASHQMLGSMTPSFLYRKRFFEKSRKPLRIV